MLWLRQSTAVTVSFGPAVSNTDGVTLVINLTGTGANQTENTTTGIRLSKNGGAFAARHATAGASTYDAFGNYLVPLDTTDTNTLGTLRMQFANAAAFCPLFQDFMVVNTALWDALFASSGGAIPNLVAGATNGLFIAGTNAATTVTTALTTTFTGNLTGSVASVTGAVGSVTGAVGSVTGNVGGNVTGSVGSLTTNNDKTGYALTAAYDLAKTAAQAGDAMTLTSGERNSTADALLNRDMSIGSDSGSATVRTVRQALRFLRNKWTVAASTLTVYKEDDSTSSWTATVSTDAAAVPIIGNDPAGP